MVTIKIPRKHGMNFLHLTKNSKLLCQVYHRRGLLPMLATEDEIIENKNPIVKNNKGHNIRAIMYDL